MPETGVDSALAVGLAVAVLLLLILVVPIVLFQRFAKREGAG